MSYFSRRNKLVEEFSGYQEVSGNLRSRLLKVCQKYLFPGGFIGVGQEDLWVRKQALEHELYLELCKSDVGQIILNDPYYDVFTAIEIYLSLSKVQANRRYHQDILPDFARAFNLSGSVYFVSESGEINLRVDEELAENLEVTKQIMKEQPSAYQQFFTAVGDLMGRKSKPQDMVKDIYIALEDYLKGKTKQKDFPRALSYLEKEKLIVQTQKALLEKLLAFRSDVYGSAHAGKSSIPDEIDALWFLETVIAQIKLIDRRLKEKK